MSDSEVDYLQPGFDPATLTNPRLRSILVTYNVHYPSNAKKPDLVQLFHNHVAPQASRILARRARAKRSSMGIIDVASATDSHSATFDEEDDDDRRRYQRRSSPRKRQSRSASYQPQQPPVTAASDSEPDAQPTLPPPRARRARTKTPQVKLEPTDEEVDRATSATPFTDDNPFQSGSSPLAASSSAATTASRRQRTVTPRHEPKPKRAPSSAAPAAATVPRIPSSPAYESPLRKPSAYRAAPSPFASRYQPEPEPDSFEPDSEEEVESEVDDEDDEDNEDDDPLAPGAEFTPEAQLELEQSLAQEEAAARSRRQGGLAKQRRKSSSRGRGGRRSRGVLSALKTPLLVLTLALLGAYGAWYRREKLAVGFCGLGRPAVPLLAGQLDELVARFDQLDWVPLGVNSWVHDWVVDARLPPRLQVLVEPQCEPCPPHAFCYSDFSVRCESGYLLQPHPLSLGGLVPLPPTCTPDGERARRIKAVADKAVEALRDRRAKWECGDLVDDDGQVLDGPAVDEPVLKEALSAKRSRKMSKEEFDDLWVAALGDIESRDEVEAETADAYPASDPRSVPNTRLSSTSLARLPLACAVRRSIRLGLARYRFPLFLLAASILAALYTRARFRARRAMLARVPALVDLVLERLAAQKELWLYEGEDGVGGGSDGATAAAVAAAAASADDSAFLPDPFLFLPQLRDDVLRTTHSLAARERIWKHVRAVVEQNSNVRTGQREGRSGEVGRAWEWIGPVGTAAVGGGGAAGDGVEASARRRRSGRVSWMAPAQGGGGRDRDTTTSSAGSTSVAAAAAAATDVDGPRGGGGVEHSRSALHRRWQESRPIY